MKHAVKQPWQLDLETRYTDANAQAVADAQIATHNTNASAHGLDLTDIPIEIPGARDDPEAALAALLTALATLGLIIDSTAAS